MFLQRYDPPSLQAQHSRIRGGRSRQSSFLSLDNKNRRARVSLCRDGFVRRGTEFLFLPPPPSVSRWSSRLLRARYAQVSKNLSRQGWSSLSAHRKWQAQHPDHVIFLRTRSRRAFYPLALTWLRSIRIYLLCAICVW